MENLKKDIWLLILDKLILAGIAGAIALSIQVMYDKSNEKRAYKHEVSKISWFFTNSNLEELNNCAISLFNLTSLSANGFSLDTDSTANLYKNKICIERHLKIIFLLLDQNLAEDVTLNISIFSQAGRLPEKKQAITEMQSLYAEQINKIHKALLKKAEVRFEQGNL